MGGTRPRLLTRVPSLGGTIDRQRLLDIAASRPIVAISGPTGSGTTTLAAQIAADAAGGIDGRGGAGGMAWCRLAPGFDQVSDVVHAAADAAGLDIESPSSRIVDATDQLLDAVDAGITTLVIDDHHLAAGGDIDRLIAESADLLPDGTRIVVAGASRPAGLIGLVAPQRIAVIGPDELAFTAEESAALFGELGADVTRADAWRAAVGGWAQAMVAGACSPDATPSEYLGSLLDQQSTDPAVAEVLAATASLPYVTDSLLATLVDTDIPTLGELVAASPLLVDHGGDVRMAEDVAAELRHRLGDVRVRRIQRDAAPWFVDADPVTAIDVLLDADHAETAADVLADHLSEIGVERALTWLYRLPADLRRRFPPVLAAGQATVEVDTALATAQLRVETADSERSRREALLALGSIEAHRGELAAAATALEAALRASRGDEGASRVVSYELAHTRFLLGDVTGARVVLDDAGPTTAAALLAVELDIVDGTSSAGRVIDGADAFADAARAMTALVAGDLVTADTASSNAYEAAIEVGGEALTAGALVRAVTLLRGGRGSDAEIVVDEMERRLGARHRLSRVIGAVVRERISRRGNDRGRHERDERRLRDHRQTGYALVERLVDRLLGEGPGGVAGGGPSGDSGVVVRVLGTHCVDVGERTVRRSEWKSKKALEVLTVLAAAGTRGARREALIEDVWPGRDPDKGRTLLRTALSEIRKRLEPDRPTGEPSAHLEAADDVIRLDGRLDLDVADELVGADPVAAFAMLAPTLAPEVESAEWAQEWIPRIERLLVAAASAVPVDADLTVRVDALEALIAAEPWKRDHYDALAEAHRSAGDDAAAADVERRWFADDG